MASSVEVEFRDMSHGICDGMWLEGSNKELKILTKNSKKMFCDNKATISIAKNHVHHDRTKHMKIVHPIINEKVDGVTKLAYTPSLQTTNILTKALPQTNFQNLRSKVKHDWHLQPSLKGSGNQIPMS